MYDQSAVLGRAGSVFGNMLGQDPFGGGAGRYVFTDLTELDAVAVQWRAERDKIWNRNQKIQNAIDLAAPPAEDMMSVGQVEAFTASLHKLKDHNQALLAYADSYVLKLDAARASYAAMEDASAAGLKTQHPGI